MFARLSRIVPMLIVLAVVAAIVYIVAAWRYSPNRAKELLIRIFTAITGAVSAFFLLVCAYAWLERNGAVFDLSFSFLLTALIGLAVTRICRAVFLPQPRVPHQGREDDDSGFPCQALAEEIGKPSYEGLKCGGGELGIRTPDTLLGCTRLAGEHLRPLGQLSAV